MPYKHNESCRHKIENARYKVTNRPEYNDALRRRGAFTIWFTEDAIAKWLPAKTGSRGRLQEYSNVAIKTAVFIRQVFHLLLRQTERLIKSLVRVIKADIAISDFGSISRFSIGLPRHDETGIFKPLRKRPHGLATDDQLQRA